MDERKRPQDQAKEEEEAPKQKRVSGGEAGFTAMALTSLAH